MTLTGWSAPESPTGRSSLVSAPPWHYSGEIVSVEFTADPGQVAALMPPGLKPAGDGSAAFVFADWCSACEDDPRFKRDPARSQYREAFVVLFGSYRGRPTARVPYMWVDNDLSLVRGLVQGFPKKLGQIAMTRAVEIGRGGHRKEIGGRFAGRLSALGRQLCWAEVAIDTEGEDIVPPAVAVPPLLTRHWPRLDGEGPAVHEYALNRAEGFELGRVFSGPAELEFGTSDFEELHALAPTAVGRGYVHSMAYTIVGGRTLPIPEA